MQNGMFLGKCGEQSKLVAGMNAPDACDRMQKAKETCCKSGVFEGKVAKVVANISVGNDVL